MEIIWKCDKCAEPIADGEGSVALLLSEQFARTSACAAARAKNPDYLDVAAILALPPRAHWHVLHDKCDERIDEGQYWIAVARIRTQAQALLWAAHLSKKRWISDTDWDDVLRYCAGGGDLP